VILSDIPPHREIAAESGFIQIIPANDAPAFARAIKNYREIQVEERIRIGRECRKLIETRFSLPAMHKGYAEIYSQISGMPTGVLLQELS
jgi:glycosyltransferase involved in cell wall biosynthesis